MQFMKYNKCLCNSLLCAQLCTFHQHSTTVVLIMITGQQISAKLKVNVSIFFPQFRLVVCFFFEVGVYLFFGH